MKLLGIDYGRKKTGLAVGDTDSKFAEPLIVIKSENKRELIKKISQYAKVERVGKIVLGISEGKMAEETKKFGREIRVEIELPVVYSDETLTTHEAQRLSLESGVKRKKRKDMEDAFAAALMLQNYLESTSFS